MKRATVVAGCALIALCAVPLIDWLSSGGGLSPMPSRPYAARFLILSAFVPYAAALIAFGRSDLPVRFVAGVAAVCALLLIVVPPHGSQDVFSYLFYGRMWEQHGVNPFTDAPSQLASDPWFAFVRWPDTPSAYGPLWTGLNGGFSAIAGSHLWIALALAKAVTVAGVAVAGWFVARSHQDPSRRGARLAMVVWNPLVLFSVAGDGHVDGVLIGLLAAALFARSRERMGATTAALTAAALIKPYAGLFLILHLAACARAGMARRSVEHASAAAGVAALAHAPFWAGLDTFAGLRDVATRFSATPARDIRRLLDAAGLSRAAASSLVRVAGAAILVWVVVWLVRTGAPAAKSWGIGFAAYLAVTPWFLPWHALPLLPIAAVQRPDQESVPLTAAAVSLSASSLVAVPVVRAGVPLASAAVTRRLGRRRSAKINT